MTHDISAAEGATAPPIGDAHLASWLARTAGLELVRLRAELGFARVAELRAAGDRRSHELLVEALGRWRPADAVLSEEGADDLRRLGEDRVWIVDPLDGTREFAEPGRTDWAVHVALWQRGLGLAAGAVALPARGVVLDTVVPPTVVPADASTPPRLVTSRTRPPAFVQQLVARLGGVQISMGSAGAKIAAVICGEADAYVHAGGQYEWDSAAPVAVAVAAGLHASRVDGTELEYNRADPRLPDLVVCRSELAEPVLGVLAELGVTRDEV